MIDGLVCGVGFHPAVVCSLEAHKDAYIIIFSASLWELPCVQSTCALRVMCLFSLYIVFKGVFSLSVLDFKLLFSVCCLVFVCDHPSNDDTP